MIHPDQKASVAQGRGRGKYEPCSQPLQSSFPGLAQRFANTCFYRYYYYYYYYHFIIGSSPHGRGRNFARKHSVCCIPFITHWCWMSSTQARTHRIRRPKRTPTRSVPAQFPNTDHTSRVVPPKSTHTNRIPERERERDTQSGNVRLLFCITMWEWVLSFIFRWALGPVSY